MIAMNKPDQFWIVTKASLLAGVGFALALNWGQTRYSLHDFHVELDMMKHVERLLPPRGLKPHCVHPAEFHLRPGVRMPAHTDIQADIDREC